MAFFSSRRCSSEQNSSRIELAGALDHEELLHVELEMRPQDVHSHTRCQRQLSIQPNRSITALQTLERAFDFDTRTIWSFLSEEHEPRTECVKVQCRHFFIKLWTLMPSKLAKSIALSKCPMFQKIGFFIIFFMWSKVMMLTMAMCCRT